MTGVRCALPRNPDAKVIRADGRRAFEHRPVFITQSMIDRFGSYAAARAFYAASPIRDAQPRAVEASKREGDSA